MTSLPIAALFPKAWAALRATCSHASHEAAARLRPSGFDPSRVVTVTAADWNGDSFDGSPFEPVPAPQWLVDAIRARRVVGDCPGSTDYAVWWVHAPYGKVVAEPGDKIVLHDNGDLGVIRWNAARDSDGSGEAGETRSGSPEGESAGPEGIAQNTGGSNV